MPFFSDHASACAQAVYYGLNQKLCKPEMDEFRATLEREVSLFDCFSDGCFSLPRMAALSFLRMGLSFINMGLAFLEWVSASLGCCLSFLIGLSSFLS